MGRRKKRLKYPKIKIPYEDIITASLKPDVNLDDDAFKNLYSLMDEYHGAIDLKLEQDKQKREDTKKLFQEIEEGLKSLRESTPNIPPRELPLKNYCEVNIGGKWVVNPELKPMGAQSFIYNKTRRGNNE